MSGVTKRVDRPRRLRSKLLWASAGSVVALGALWVAIHEVPWLGPALADGVRSVVGPAPVAWAEDVAYGAADWVRLKVGGDAAPTTYWELPAAATGTPDETGKSASDGEAPAESPRDMPPPEGSIPFENVRAEGDGRWLAMRASNDGGATGFYKTLIHPDRMRPFAAVAIVAIDLAQLELHLVAGNDEPKSQSVRREERPGVVPEEHRATLVAAFNGGFKAMHGNYGMRVGDKLFIPPRDIACTIGKSPDGSLDIRTFSKMKEAEPSLSWFRQTPPCLVEAGEPNPGLLHEFNRNWGATVGGDTIIRRSAFGLSKDKRYAYYALGDAVTAQSLGRAMQAVGAHDAAQLDVNYSYPRFMLYEASEGGVPMATAPLLPDLKYSPTDYVGAPSQRDFFYVTRKKRSAS